MYLKRLHKFFFKAILENPIKFFNTTIFLSAVAFLIFGEVNYWVKKKLIHQFKNGDKYCYVVPSGERGDMNVEISDTPLEIVGEYVAVKDQNDWYLLSLLIGIITGVFFVMSFFASDDLLGWDFRAIWIEVLHDDIQTHSEIVGNDNHHYYVIDGKLLTTSKNEIIVHMPGKIKDYIKSPNMFPQFKGTKDQIRDNKLDDLINT